MNKTINQLIEYGLKNHMISKEDESYAVNLLLDLLKIVCLVLYKIVNDYLHIPQK